jgi:hypothetical protein
MSVASSQVQSNEFLKRYVYTITGDGSTISFIIDHNLNKEDILVQAREVQDNLREVFLDNYPDPSDSLNKLIISFDFAPTALQSFKIIIIG